MNSISNHIKKYIPEQIKGFQRDTFIKIELDENIINSYYEIFKSRILDVDKWGEYCTTTGVKFLIFNKQTNRNVKLNDFICITSPAISSNNILREFTDYWVKVNKIISSQTDNESYVIIELSPCASPNSNSKEIAHFYKAIATNTIILHKQNSQITLSIHGRNEFPNVKTNSKFKLLRNLFFSNLPIIGLDKYLWKEFAHNIINNEI